MPSLESKIQTELYSTITALGPKPNGDDPKDDLIRGRSLYAMVASLSTEVPGVNYATSILGGHPALHVQPDRVKFGTALLYFHGGGFTGGSPFDSHRKIAAHLATVCETEAWSVDYPLSPEHQYPAAIEACLAAYQDLLTKVDAKKVVFAGDSCGGNLATTTALLAKQRGLPVPGACISLSPWYDMSELETQTGSMVDNVGVDKISNPVHIELNIKAYRGDSGVERRDPLLSPVWASDEELKGLSPHWISVTGQDMLKDQGLALAERLKAVGVEAVADVHEEVQHVIEFMAGRASEANESLARIGEWVKKKLVAN